MNKKYIYITIFLIIPLVIFSLIGCSSKYPIQPKSDIKGKFVFYSLRDMEDFWSGYILKHRKITLLEKNVACLRWSPDGGFIAYKTKDGITIFSMITKEKERITVLSRVECLAWSPDGKGIIYTTEDGIYKNAHTRFFRYSIQTKEHKLIKDFEIGHNALELSISKDGKILFYDGLDNNAIFIMDINGENLKLMRKRAMDSSWFPDGKHIGFFTNIGKDGKLINDKQGVYFKMNIETGETTPIRELTSSDWQRKISRDGKYLYYSKSYGKDGRYIVVSPLEKPDIEIPITKPVEMRPNNYSQDLDADWYQGN